jgi:hypothetical protein
MICGSARKAIASITKKVTKKATSKKKSKDMGTSKRRRKDDTSEEEEEPDNPNDSNFDLADESASASFMVEEEDINQGGEAQNVAENVEAHASDDDNANVGNMGHANVDEDAYAMPPPPPPAHPMQPQWEPPTGYFDSYFANIQQSMNTQFQQMQSGFNSHFEAYGQQMNDTF